VHVDCRDTLKGIRCIREEI